MSGLAAENLASLNDRGNALQLSGRFDDALQAYQSALHLSPNSGEVLYNLGDALCALGRLDESIAAFTRAMSLSPNDAQVHNHLGLALYEKGDIRQAIACFVRAIELRPTYAGALNNLGVALISCRRLDDAIAVCQRSLELDPNQPQVHNNLATAYKEGGRIDAAAASLRRALELKPDYHEAHSTLLYLMYLDPSHEPAAILQAHQGWEKQHIKAVNLAQRAHEVHDRSMNRKLRIGYVSSDFRDHATTRFLLSPFEDYDRTRFSFVCFSGVKAEDGMTRRLRSAVDEWHRIVGLCDDAAAELIARCRIDILLDLSLHLAGGRPGVFARKPAPIQISALAYPGTTGLSAIDYRLTDSILDPPDENDCHHSEQSLRLKTHWCYRPWEIDVPVTELPARREGRVTFVSVNSFGKVSAAALSTWAEVLKRVPTARLIIVAPAGSHLQRVDAVMTAAGVEMSRIQFVQPMSLQAYLQCYSQIDIALDAFPCSGGTTTCDALWMGVPVVSLAGRIAMGRAGASILNQINLAELVAQTQEQYVEIAAALAANIERLAELRRTLRLRVLHSPLSDRQSFIRDLEAQYEMIWKRWCERVR